ncbi:Gfo/Idh/MocA family oxidoreductase [Leptolyngbya cf. ectocarpi LEGE 11479]|uniref:Gfo/Idh/MocA family oxidoreductase n=1 Tax=Leptolyngbya cf. ectocarpi LEGE 11479 TaxID=1828722 RepID=A0A928ZY28_LEPEC|nr:Gfo/Idh/MocA family oxidoreductase [Leptolyngbya ectocarpi]MBE9069556.1 Gfo/Idh/MocA family oxidoreductase [Leptolyngbya cf. ectocarpi LEGE 11479]
MTIYAGVIGTGFAARKRVEALQASSRAHVVAVASRNPERARHFGEQHQIAFSPIEMLWSQPQLDLVFICTVNAAHADLVQQALEHHKHVVVEYPLALDVAQATQLVGLARARQRLLHIEHIELIGGLHLAMKQHLSAIGKPHYVNYRTLVPQQSAPKKWSYCPNLVGFPLMAALSRIRRLTDLLGPVGYVTCQGGLQPPSSDYFHSCLYSAQLRFCSGTLAELTYGKGEGLWQRHRYMEIRGDQGYLSFDGNQGRLITAAGEQEIAAAPRQGLFKKDTQWVLDHLLEGTPLYGQPEESLYALQVAAALQQAVQTGQRVAVSND